MTWCCRQPPHPIQFRTRIDTMEKLAEEFLAESELQLEHRMEEFDLAKSQLLAQINESAAGGVSGLHRRKQNTQTANNDCQIENSTVKLLNSLDAAARGSSSSVYVKSSAAAAAASAASLAPSPGASAPASPTASPDKRKKTGVERDEEYEKLRQLLTFDEAPKHLQFNPFIRHGYRTYLSTKLCIESIFWWTNETVNIWSHIFGLFLFIGLTISDINYLNSNASLIDKVMVTTVLVCFQFCMVFSSVYHTFSCRSEKHYECFLSMDLLGIALSLLAIYISGIYYAFWCDDFLRHLYTVLVAGIFITAMLMQVPRFNVTSQIKMSVFVCWAVFGILPTMHWAVQMGGFSNAMVALLIPRVTVMYLISGIAFLIYVTRIPERWLAGKVDFFGHSHNWWHIFVLIALYYWHNTGMEFAMYMIDHDCIEDRAKCYSELSQWA